MKRRPTVIGITYENAKYSEEIWRKLRRVPGDGVGGKRPSLWMRKISLNIEIFLKIHKMKLDKNHQTNKRDDSYD